MREGIYTLQYSIPREHMIERKISFPIKYFSGVRMSLSRLIEVVRSDLTYMTSRDLTKGSSIHLNF